MANEAARFKRVSDFRVADVEQAYFSRPEALYKKHQHEQEGAVQYVGFSQRKHKTIEDALAQVRRELDGN